MRTVIISHNNDPMYSFFEPIVVWAWKRFGWDCKCYVTETVIETQMIRLYAGEDFEADTLLMTSDIDILPLSDYWNPKSGEITCYGRNLSEEHQPICYVAIEAWQWLDLFGKKERMEWDIESYGDHWTADQDRLTLRLLRDDLINIPRNIASNSHLPIGRIDRYNWELTLQQTERIDSHLLRPGYTDKNWPRIMALIEECLQPTIDEIKWLNEYRNQFLKTL